jgi:hypothetical protein
MVVCCNPLAGLMSCCECELECLVSFPPGTGILRLESNTLRLDGILQTLIGKPTLVFSASRSESATLRPITSPGHGNLAAIL